MYTVKGELDLYIYDKNNKLIRHHVQSNYDTIRSRLEPTFNDTCYRLTRWDCVKSFLYPQVLEYDDISTFPIYPNEPLFIPSTITPNIVGDGKFVVSYDKGSTWWIHNGTAWVSTSVTTASELRASGMDSATLSSITKEQYKEKYVDHIVIKATSASPGDAILGYDFILGYDSSLIDPYYVRWISDAPRLDKYITAISPISSGRTGNTYSISVSNISGVAPLEVDTLLTTRGVSSSVYVWGTFTYIGITVEIDQILIGTYTITVVDEPDIYAGRTLNAAYSYWGTTTPSYTDGIMGGVRHHGAETSAGLYSYNGGPAANQWMYPFKPDKSFRQISLGRSIGLPGTASINKEMYGENIINPAYGLTSTGSIELWSSDSDSYSNLGFAPILFRYLFLNSGSSSNTDYLLYYLTRVDDFLNLDRIYPIRFYNNDTAYMGTNYWPAFQLPLKDPDNPIIWSYIMYDKLAVMDKYIPVTASNPFHDLIIEVWDTYLTIRRYGRETIFRLDANENEIFNAAVATFEDPSGYDLTVHYKDNEDGLSYIASIPITIVRDISARDFKITVVGDLTSRFYIGNIYNPRSSNWDGPCIYHLLKVQDAKGGPWTTSRLMSELKTLNSDDFLEAVHEDNTGDVSDSTHIFDQKWDYRHFKKYGNISTSVDSFGDQSIEFDGTGLVYLYDTKGPSGRGFKWIDQQPPLSVYMEFQPTALQDSTLLQNRDTWCKLKNDGTLTIAGVSDLPSTRDIVQTYPENIYTQYMLYGLEDLVIFVDPITKNLKEFISGYLGATYNGYTIKERTPTGWTTYPNVYQSPELVAVPSFSTSISTAENGIYWDSTTSNIYQIRIDNTASCLKLCYLCLTNIALSTEITYTVGGSTFTHALGSAYKTVLYTDSNEDPILIIYSSPSWVDGDGLLKINLKTRLLTKIAITGTKYVYAIMSGNNDNRDQAVAYKNSNGERCIVVIANPITGVVYKYNLDLGTVVTQTVGPLFNLTTLQTMWGLTPSSNYTTCPWSIRGLRGTTYAIMSSGPTSFSSTTAVTFSNSIINLENFQIIDDNTSYIRNSNPFPASSQGNGVIRAHYQLKTKDIVGYPGSNIIPDELFEFMYASTSYNVYGGYTGALYMSTLSTDQIYSEDTYQPTMNYTTGVNNIAFLEYGDFTLGVVNDKITYIAPSRRLTSYDYHSTGSLANLAVGGKLTYNSGTSTDPLSYTASNFYQGRTKNIVLKTQVPTTGSYRFTPHLYTLGYVDSFFTTFIGNTTFLIAIQSLSTSNLTKMYFLDTNNSMTLTLITDVNKASVTPNTLEHINNSLPNIKTLHSNSGKIGLVYYNINGDITETDVSKTYVKYKCSNPSYPIYAKSYRRKSIPIMFSKNGNLLYLDYNMGVRNQVNQITSYLSGSIETPGIYGLDVVYKKDYVMAYEFHTAYQFTVGNGWQGNTLLVIDSKDNIIIKPLSYVNNTDETQFGRWYLMSDVFKDISFGSFHTKQSNNVGATDITFYQKNELTKTVQFIPGGGGSVDGVSNTVQHFPLMEKNKTVSTSYPYPIDAPLQFKQTSNSVGYKSWGSLRWYFVDGSGTSFINDEIISFAVCNNHGYAIDNWQVVNNFNILLKSGTDVATNQGISNSCSVSGEMIGWGRKTGEYDKISTLIDQPTNSDKFFLIFD